MSRIQDEFLDKSVIEGFPPILNAKDAISLVRICKTKNVKVLGIDGFHVFGQSIQPDMEESVDFSSTRKKISDCWSEAEKFLVTRKNSELYFEVVIDE